jgi:hypothetical protein
MKYFAYFAGISLMVTLLACGENTKEEQNDLPDDIVEEKTVPVYDTFSYHAYDLTASYLAGVLPSDSLAGSSEVFNGAWEKYADAFDQRWAQYSEQEMKLIQDWCKKHINTADSVFYPFSGPDFNYLNIMFPETRHAVLIGLEKPGSIPSIQEMPSEKRSLLLEKLTSGLQNNLELGFFRTLGMKERLNEDLLNGTIPVLMVFLKRHGFDVLNVYPVEPDSNAWLAADTSSMYNHQIPDSFSVGVAMKYRKPQDSVVRELVYLSIDLTDKALDSAGYLPFIKTAAENRSVLFKAASYLPHKPHFSDIHDAVMDGAVHIVTDPTGIPFSSFDNLWTVNVYGEYGGPIRLFETRVQKDLAEYCEQHQTEPLPFRFGYHPSKWLLIDAERKKTDQE